MAARTKPDDWTMSKPNGYKPVEKINQGPSGAPGGRVSAGHNQSSDGGGKDSLIPLLPMQQDPYRARPDDFPINEVDEFTKQGGAIGAASGKDDLAKLNLQQQGPRHVEDGGPGSSGAGTPTEWNSGGRSARVAAAFPITRGAGESNSKGGQVGIEEYVDLQTGYVRGGSTPTRVGEITQHDLKIPS